MRKIYSSYILCTSDINEYKENMLALEELKEQYDLLNDIDFICTKRDSYRAEYKILKNEIGLTDEQLALVVDNKDTGLAFGYDIKNDKIIIWRD